MVAHHDVYPDGFVLDAIDTRIPFLVVPLLPGSDRATNIARLKQHLLAMYCIFTSFGWDARDRVCHSARVHCSH